jgi:hypothetical protein
MAGVKTPEDPPVKAMPFIAETNRISSSRFFLSRNHAKSVIRLFPN